jgi:hypothetical protein
MGNILLWNHLPSNLVWELAKALGIILPITLLGCARGDRIGTFCCVAMTVAIGTEPTFRDVRAMSAVEGGPDISGYCRTA